MLCITLLTYLLPIMPVWHIGQLCITYLYVMKNFISCVHWFYSTQYQVVKLVLYCIPKKVLTKWLAPCNIGNHYNKEFLLWIQVTQRQTGEVLVLKELLHYDDEANSSFLKEVSSLQRVLHKLKYTGWKCGFLFFYINITVPIHFHSHLYNIPFVCPVFALLTSVCGVIFFWIISLGEKMKKLEGNFPPTLIFP